MSDDDYSDEMLNLDMFFDERTMSVHLVENNPPRAKRGAPGDWSLVELSDRILTYEELEILGNAIIESAHNDRGSFMEIEEEGAAVVQLGNLRIAIAMPPFADKYE
ncbi:MAG: PINc/VapC family ATPase, partial [Candidatus Thorarchaeota archaeon]